MKIVKEFSRFADEYDTYNIIQKEVAKKLIAYVEKRKYGTILDLGSGDGAVYNMLVEREIQFDNFVALDFSKEMLALHPSAHNVEKICMDFNESDLFSIVKKSEVDIVISSSALQWSGDIYATLSSISSDAYLSLFTANTFKTLHNTANIISPIYSKSKILEALDRLFIYECEIVEYKLNFNSVHEMLRYIKHSGVNGGVKQLDFREIKQLIEKYPLNYLEFEVIFVKVRGRKE
jgi:malonyl-CoA O-methyltransferase